MSEEEKVLKIMHNKNKMFIITSIVFTLLAVFSTFYSLSNKSYLIFIVPIIWFIIANTLLATIFEIPDKFLRVIVTNGENEETILKDYVLKRVKKSCKKDEQKIEFVYPRVVSFLEETYNPGYPRSITSIVTKDSFNQELFNAIDAILKIYDEHN